MSLDGFRLLSAEFTGVKYNSRISMAHFGVPVEVICKLWNYINEQPQQIIKPVHLMWTLYFLKQNPSDLVNMYKASTKTWLKYVKLTLLLLEDNLPEV
jgi:hypothetical protein